MKIINFKTKNYPTGNLYQSNRILKFRDYISRVVTEAGKAGKRPVLQILAGKAGKHVPFTTTKAWKAGKCIFQSRKKSFSSVFDYYVSNHFVLLFYY